jgi:hypothetical protein
MDDLRSKLSTAQDEYDRASHKKHLAEELVVCASRPQHANKQDTIMKKRLHYNKIIQNHERALGTVETTKSALQTVKDTPDRSEAEIAKVRETQKSDARNRAEISIRMAVRFPCSPHYTYLTGVGIGKGGYGGDEGGCRHAHESHASVC